VPVPGLTHLEATAIQIMLAGRPVKVLAAYISPSRPLIGADLDSCFDGGLPALLAGDMNAKYVEWNSRLNTRRGKLLRDYADENSCLIFGPDSPNLHPIQPVCYSLCLGHRDNQTPSFLGASDFLLCTMLGPPPGTYRHYVSLILSTPTGSP
jgi:hypothetical protein